MIDDAELVRARHAGVPVAEIAAAAGLSPTWVYRRLKRADPGIGRQGPRPCPVPVEQLAEEYYAGASILKLATRHGLYYKRVRNLLREHGVALRPSTRKSRGPRLP